jgi:hypothetical protein
MAVGNTSCWRSVISIWNTNTDKPVSLLDGHHKESIQILLLLSDVNMASYSNNGIVNIWDWTSGLFLRTINSSGSMRGLLFSYTNELLAFDCMNIDFNLSIPRFENIAIFQFEFWNWKTGRLVKKADTHDEVGFSTFFKQSNYVLTEYQLRKKREKKSSILVWDFES